MRRLLIGDRKMRLRDEGAGPKTPLLCIHGAGCSSVVWMDVVRRLAPARRVVAPDLPGHGQSDRWHEISLALYRDAVGTVARVLEIDKAILVGHSMGGAIALLCALAWPERVAGLVIVTSGARLRVAPEVFRLLTEDWAHAPERFARMQFSPATPVDLVERWRAVLIAAEQEVMLGDLRACDGFDVRSELGRLKMPALVVAAEDDLMTPPKLSAELTAGLGNARQIVIAHAGHLAHLERADAFHEALGSFLAEV
jgi:pimeloyl-ACP methyl ester carboxylesterase